MNEIPKTKNISSKGDNSQNSRLVNLFLGATSGYFLSHLNKDGDNPQTTDDKLTWAVMGGLISLALRKSPKGANISEKDLLSKNITASSNRQESFGYPNRDSNKHSQNNGLNSLSHTNMQQTSPKYPAPFSFVSGDNV